MGGIQGRGGGVEGWRTGGGRERWKGGGSVEDDCLVGLWCEALE